MLTRDRNKHVPYGPETRQATEVSESTSKGYQNAYVPSQKINPSRSHSTVPCVPTHVVAVMDCSDNTAAVTWSPTQGALSYRAVAQSLRGAISSCESTDPQCILANLTCGVPYTVQVLAVNERCSSLPSHMAEFQTGEILNTPGSSCTLHTQSEHRAHSRSKCTQQVKQPRLIL